MELGLACPDEIKTFITQFYIPTYIIVSEGRAERLPDVPKCPVLVFINSTSGGQLGGDLLTTCRSLLNKNQVFDLGEEAPDKVLRRVFLNIERLKQNGDEFAPKLEKKLRIIVAGGDGTASWLLGVVSDMKLSQQPPIATVPLGTGNNLPFAFGWGRRNPDTDRDSVMAFLDQVKKATEMEMDSWHIMLRMKARKEQNCEPLPPLELPHSLHAIHRVLPTHHLNLEGYDTFQGGFWNYFSMGMDAQISYAFHSERKLNPDKFKHQLVNQTTYAKLGCTQGWFCAPLVHSSSENIGQICKVKVMKKHGNWQDLPIASSIRSVVCINLPSFSGGLDPWGMLEYSYQESAPTISEIWDSKTESSKRRNRSKTPENSKEESDETEKTLRRGNKSTALKVISADYGASLYEPITPQGYTATTEPVHSSLVRDFTPPYVDDGLLEVVGFKNARHGLVLLAPNGHGTRLAQAHRIRFEFRKGGAEDTYMRIDGEPWKQPLPSDDEDDDTVVVEISHLGQVKVLATNERIAASVLDPSAIPPSRIDNEDDGDSDGEDESRGEEWRKFGAAESFRIPDDVDISHLS